jgi:Tetratricopeptide repeat
MRPSPRIALAAAALLLPVSVGHAQVVGGFGQRQAIGFQIRSGPYNSFGYRAGGYGWGFGPIYGPVPSWYYGWPGIPIINNPIVVQPPSPPVVIQNIINAPGGGPGRAAFIPPEFADPPAQPAPKPGKPAPEKRVGGPVIPPEPPKAPAGLAGRADADRVVESGSRAFADGQYGRALELFRRAVVLTPDEPSAHYLVSQARFALGKYREAVTAIDAGMKVRPDWPAARFNSRDLYWKKPVLFDDHLAALRQAVAGFPDDANLVFLLGHQLWFDGKRDEARPQFQKAAALAKGQTPAEAFLAK